MLVCSASHAQEAETKQTKQSGSAPRFMVPRPAAQGAELGKQGLAAGSEHQKFVEARVLRIWVSLQQVSVSALPQGCCVGSQKARDLATSGGWGCVEVKTSFH